MDGAVHHFDAAERHAEIVAREFVVIAGNVDHARAPAHLAQQLLHDVIVRPAVSTSRLCAAASRRRCRRRDTMVSASLWRRKSSSRSDLGARAIPRCTSEMKQAAVAGPSSCRVMVARPNLQSTDRLRQSARRFPYVCDDRQSAARLDAPASRKENAMDLGIAGRKAIVCASLEGAGQRAAPARSPKPAAKW